MPGNVFLNYRRGDTAGHAGRLYDRLNWRFPGRVFRDVTGIAPGLDFVQEIGRKLNDCRVLIVLIGRQWLTVTDDQGRPRLHDPQDFVRLEVATGLQRNILVIPVLVDGAQRMPTAAELPDDLKPLARRNALEITEPDFDNDAGRLIQAVEQALGEPPLRQREGEGKKKSRLGLFVGLVAAALVVGLVAVVAFLSFSQSSGGEVGSSQLSSTGGAQAPLSPAPTSAAPVSNGAFNPVGTWQIDDVPISYRLYNGGRMEMYNSLNGVTIPGQWSYSPDARLLRLATSNGTLSVTVLSGNGSQHVVQINTGYVTEEGVMTRLSQ